MYPPRPYRPTKTPDILRVIADWIDKVDAEYYTDEEKAKDSTDLPTMQSDLRSIANKIEGLI